MENEKAFDLNEILGIEQFYQTEGVFYEPFFDFERKLSSLQRFYAMNRRASRIFLNESQASAVLTKAKEKYSELIDIHFEITDSDIEYFDDFLLSSTLAQMFSLFESFLLEVIEVAQEEMQSKEPIVKDNVPLINRYIKWLTNVAGCEVKISKDTWATLDVLRHVRNQFVHANIGGVPDQMRDKFAVIQGNAKSVALTANEGYVYIGFKTIADAVKQVELGFLTRFSS